MRAFFVSVCINYDRRPLSGGRFFANVLFIYLFLWPLAALIRPWLTEVRESFTRGGP